MREVEITQEMIDRAQKRADEMGGIKNSLTKGAGNLAGFLGEEMVLKLFPSCLLRGSKDYDLIYEDFMGDMLNVEVKTKRRNVPPKEDYTCHISKTSAHQDPDVYVFCQANLKELPYRGWVLGWLPKDLFYMRAEFRQKGQPDGFGFKEKVDCYVCKVSDLYDIDLF